jgi:hypothetical protein
MGLRFEGSLSKLLEAELPRRDSALLTVTVGDTLLGGIPWEGPCFSSGVWDRDGGLRLFKPRPRLCIRS